MPTITISVSGVTAFGSDCPSQQRLERAIRGAIQSAQMDRHAAATRGADQLTYDACRAERLTLLDQLSQITVEIAD